MLLYTTLSLLNDLHLDKREIKQHSWIKGRRSMRIVKFTALIAVLLTHVGVRVDAQSTKVELSGLISDPSGLAVPGAEVRLLNMSTDAEQSVSSGPDGQYHFFAVPPGTYTITVMKSGFTATRRVGLTLRVGDQVTVDIPLQIGNVEQAVNVTAAAPLLQASRGTVSFVVEQKKVVTLPLDGRNFIPLIALSPGVMLPPASTLPRINGSRPRVSEYIYDGISVLQPEPGQVAYFPVVDAIKEFRVETNSYSAEYGRSNGGVIMVNHKSGSNEFHGSLFEFFRNEAINARNLFSTTGPKPRFRRNQYGFVFGGPGQRNKTFFFADYQGTRLQTGTPRTSTVPTSLQRRGIFSTAIFDPATTRQVSGAYVRDQFLNNTISADRWDPAVKAVLDRYPLPNVFTATGQEAAANNYIRTANETTNQDQFGIRLDHTLNSRQRLFGRYEYFRDDSSPSTPLPDGSGSITAGVIGKTLTRADSVALEHNWTVSGNKVNQLRFGYTRRGFDRSSLQTGQAASQASGIPNIPVSAFSDVLPTYDVVGFQQLGPTVNGNANFTTSVTQIVDNLSWLHGRHSMKLGTDWRIEHLGILQPPSPTGSFQFTNILTSNLSATGTPVTGTGNAFASFLLGQVQTFSIDVQHDTLRPRAKIGEFFFQDDFKATKRLSLNLGVRYTLNFPSTVVDDQGAVFNLQTQKLDFLGKNGTPRAARNLEKLNFAPRIGFAFRLTDSFSVRSGYGITWIEQAGITTPYTTPFFPFIQTAGQRSLDNITPAFVLSRGLSVQVTEPNPDSGLGQGVFSVERNQKSGYAQQWNLSFQKTFRQNWSAEFGYLGSKLTNLGVPDVNMNQLTAAQLALGATLTEQVPNPFFGQIPESSSLGGPTIARQQLLRPFPRFTTVAFYRNNVGHSTYHSLQTRLERRFSGGLSVTGAYTFSKLIDDAGAVFDAAILTGPAAVFQSADSYNRRLEKDESTGSIPHVFSGSYVWEIPVGAGLRVNLSGWRNALAGGWQLAGMLRVQAGSPLAVTQATNLNAFAGFGIQRPNRVGDPESPSDQRGTARWFDTAAFSQAGQFTLGNASRNPVVGPAYRTLDVMLGKTFPIKEDVRAEFRAEAFNVTNTPSLMAPNTSFGNAAFGTITRAFDPRVYEFVMKVHF
jgi:Carboxypeptidase regulatory-like domain